MGTILGCALTHLNQIMTKVNAGILILVVCMFNCDHPEKKCFFIPSKNLWHRGVIANFVKSIFSYNWNDILPKAYTDI